MKLIVFDVADAACSLIVSPNRYGLMVDCGSHGEKDNPVDVIQNKEISNWLNMKPFVKSTGTSYPLGLLHITHPDDDHVRNAERIEDELTPYLVRKRKHEEFDDSDSINDTYIEKIDNAYRGSNTETINWGFDTNKTFQIPITTVKTDENLNKKVRNNSSIIRFIEHNGIKILLGGDLETAGWEWLIENNSDFVTTVTGGVNIYIAPHHGHKSAYSSELFGLIGNVDVVIHSKGSEAKKDETDVSSAYTEWCDGVTYTNLNDQEDYSGKVLTTRSNGSIFIQVNDTTYNILTEKASSNHEKLEKSK